MGKIVIKRNRPTKVLSGFETAEFVLTDENGVAFEVVTLEDGDLSLVKRGKSIITTATQNKVILTDDSVTLRVASNSVLDIRVNDYFEVYGDIYRINSIPEVTKQNETYYEYTIVGQGLMFDMLRVKFFNADGTGFKTSTDFPLVGNLEMFLTVLENNMKRLNVDWEKGNFSNGDVKTIVFNDDTCLSALQKICQEFKTEFWVKFEAGKYVIHTGDFGSTEPITVQYGKGKGLYNLTRKNVNENGIINRLYVAGGTQNIPSDYKGYRDRLVFGTDGVLEDSELIEAIGLKEGSLILEDIYPHREGKVTTVGSVYKFTDSTMNFDLNEKNPDDSTKYLIAGTTAKIHFNTGNLAGYEFEVKSYNHTTKEFEILPFDNQNGQVFPDPNSTAFQFSQNDKYVLLDIVMPQSYIDSAEAELLAKGTEQFYLLKQSKVSYDLNLAQDFLKTLPRTLEIGDLVKVVDEKLGIDKVIRVNQITRNFIQNGAVDDYDFKVVIADSYQIAFASQMKLEVQEIKNKVSAQIINQISRSRAGFRATEELKNLVFDTDGFLDPEIIRVGSIEVGMLSSGAQSQQLSLSVTFTPNYGGAANIITSNAGALYSQPLDKSWNIAASTETLPDNNFRYAYAKCSKSGTTGTIVYTQDKIKFDENPNDYYFLLGVLHSVSDGFRIFSLTIGATTINGGLIRTGILSSIDGATTINLNTGVISGPITFKMGTTGYDNISDKPDLTPYDSAVQYLDNILPDELQSIRDSVDGVLEQFFYEYSPTLTNIPAVEWDTEAKKADHLGDTFTNVEPFVDAQTTPDSGKSWRWVKDGAAYKWLPITNSEALQALLLAGQAQDTADSKRRVFASQPYPPYNVGDLWLKEDTGDLMVCMTEKLTGTFTSSNWEKATKYQTLAEVSLAISTANTDSLNAAKAYADAQDEANELLIKSWADGEITSAELRAQTDATNKVNAAKNYADAQDLAYRTISEAYADGLITAEEEARILQANTNLLAAKNYADAQANAANVAAKAYADGIVNDEEERAILDADNKLAQAKQYSDAQRTATEAAMQIYADGAVSDLELQMQGTIADSLNAAKAYADSQDNLSLVTANAYADGVVSDEEARAILDAQNKMEAAQSYARAQDLLLKTEMQVYADDLVTDEEQARLDQAALNLQAAKDHGDAVAEAKKIEAQAYADGEITDAEARAMADANAKMEAAKTYAETQDLLLKTQLEIYADGIVTSEEQARLLAAEQAALAAQEYTNRQAELSAISNKAYADGVLDEAEEIAIREAEKARDEAKAETERLLGGMVIGAKNLLREYDLRFDFKYWGGTGTSEEVNLNAITIIEKFVMGQIDAPSFDLVTDNNEKIEIIL